MASIDLGRYPQVPGAGGAGPGQARPGPGELAQDHRCRHRGGDPRVPGAARGDGAAGVRCTRRPRRPKRTTGSRRSATARASRCPRRAWTRRPSSSRARLRESRRLVRLPDRPGRPGQGGGRMSDPRNPHHARSRKRFGSFIAVDAVSFEVAGGKHLRSPGRKRRGQVHHHPHALRPPRPQLRHRGGGGRRHQPRTPRR